MKLIDFDAKFNLRMAKLLRSHAGEHTEDEWEDLIAEEYRKFGDTPFEDLGMTPRAYFARMSDEQLTETLKEYLLQQVNVPDFLCAELESRPVGEAVLALLGQTDEELVHFAIHLIGADARAFSRYCQMLASDEYDEHIKDCVAEVLKENADAAKEELLNLLSSEGRSYALEILSRVRERDERVYSALAAAFRGAEEEDLPLYAGYLAAYGDERALPLLLERIGRQDIGYAAFCELRFAIEALGGSYDAERDFSSDEAYKKVRAAEAERDIFGKKS